MTITLNHKTDLAHARACTRKPVQRETSHCQPEDEATIADKMLAMSRAAGHTPRLPKSPKDAAGGVTLARRILSVMDGEMTVGEVTRRIARKTKRPCNSSRVSDVLHGALTNQGKVDMRRLEGGRKVWWLK